MNERLKLLRQTLRMTQVAFGARIGVSHSAIVEYEKGTRNPSAPAVITICREFNVNEDWLRTGRGEMFNQRARDELDELLLSRGLGDGERAFVEQYLELLPEERETFLRVMEQITRAVMKAEGKIPKTLEEIFDSEEGKRDFEAGMDAEE